MLSVLPQQSSWVIQVELAIGPEEGISYLTDKGSTVSLSETTAGLCWSSTRLGSASQHDFIPALSFSFCPQPTHLANFNQVQSIQYSAMEEKDRKGMLQLNVAGAAEVLPVCLSMSL